MPSPDVQRIFKKADSKKLEAWCNTELKDFEDAGMVDAFKLFVTQQQDDKNKDTAEVWDLVRKGVELEKRGQSTDQVRAQIQEKLSEGFARIPSFVKQDLEDKCAFEVVFDKLNEDFAGAYLDSFRNEINIFRKENSATQCMEEKSKSGCSFM
ncbi:Hypothetical predicted protein [Cloeon dipterum]|uniref:Uncharacterized protein n=1 Tax=Cloeon dipterum TaxID=197152 RepID=A0A8S1CGC2_9INSE|nr:Hypothetical predicted protein [Cloeon dipterum]